MARRWLDGEPTGVDQASRHPLEVLVIVIVIIIIILIKRVFLGPPLVPGLGLMLLEHLSFEVLLFLLLLLRI